MITTKGMKLTPKLSTDMLPFSRNPLLMLLLMDLFYQNTKERFWQPRGIPREEEGVKNEGKGGLFIEKIHHQLPDKAADVRQP
jgi:hypothetical protein